MTTVLDCIERIPKSLKGIRDSYPEREEYCGLSVRERNKRKLDGLFLLPAVLLTTAPIRRSCLLKISAE